MSGYEEERVLELMHLCWKMRVQVIVGEDRLYVEYFDVGGDFGLEHPEMKLELERHRDWFEGILECLHEEQ